MERLWPNGRAGSNTDFLEESMKAKEQKELLAEFSSSLEQNGCEAKSSM